jgi:FAD-linked oxidoreductase
VIDCDAAREADIFHAARVSLGVLGVISRVRIRTVASRRLERRAWLEPVEEALGRAEDRWARHRHFALRVAPFNGLAINVCHDPTDKPAQPLGGDPDADLLDTLEGLRDRLGFAAPLRRAAARLLLSGAQPQAAVDESWKLLAAARPRRFNAMAFHLPAALQLKALAEVMAAIEKHQPDAFLPIECRRTAPDDAWLSPFQGGPTGSITVRVSGKDDFAFLYTLVEPLFRRYGGRPHWGMLHSVSGDQLAGLYPRWKDFLKVRRALDPDGRMLNPYLKGLFGI